MFNREGAVASTRPIALNNAVYEAAAKKELVYEDIADRRGNYYITASDSHNL